MSRQDPAIGQGIQEEMWRVRATISRHYGDDCSVFLVAGLVGGEGASTLAAGLALAVAHFESVRTLAIDCDLEAPSIHEGLAGGPAAGAADWSVGDDLPAKESSLSAKLFSMALDFASGGKFISFVASGQFGTMMTAARSQFDCVVIDAGSITTSSSAKILIPYADGVVLVARSGRSTTSDLSRAKSIVAEADGRILAVIRNRMT